MASISRALVRIKEDLQPFVTEQDVRDACHAVGHQWRQRVLDPVTTVHVFVLQILHANTAISHLRHLAGIAMTPAAYCRARMRLPLEVFHRLLEQTATAFAAKQSAEWEGPRTFLVDGSSTICPDVPSLQAAYGQPPNQKPGCGFPVPKLLGLFDAATGMIRSLEVQPLFSHEQSGVWKLHPLLQAGDLLVGDRGFCSFVHLAMLAARGLYGLFRMHQRMIVSFKPHRKAGGKGRPSSTYVQRLGRYDQLVDWKKPQAKPKWMTRAQYDALPATLRVREVRYWLPRKGQRTRVVTIATTLLDADRYPREMIAELYGVRWTVETHFAELKTTLKMKQVKCKTLDGVLKELAVYCLVYNLVHAVMLEAAARQQVDPRRISFTDTVRWLTTATVGEPLPALWVNPHRPDRYEPRKIKNRKDNYPKMNKPRRILKQELRLRGANAK